MPNSFKKPHLQIKNFSKTEDYKYPRDVRIKFQVTNRNRNDHGNKILNQLNEIKTSFEEGTELVKAGLDKDDVIYVQFYSAWGFKFDFDQFTENRSGNYQLLNIQVEKNESGLERYKVLVLLEEGGISQFIKKVEDYINPDKDLDSGKPKNQKLIVNIEEIQLATLEAFWTDGQDHSFPEIDKEVWWEVWLRKSNNDEAKVIHQLKTIGAHFSNSKLEFPENKVLLVKATAKQLSNSLMLLDNLSELRKPQVLNDFITHPDITYEGSKEWMQDLIDRTHFHLSGSEDEVLVSVFDSGVNNVHPLLENAIQDNYLYAWKPDWGTGDTEPNGGHGTGMAGLVLYGNLTDSLAHSQEIVIYHGIESFKVCHPSLKTDPELFGSIYQDGCNSLIADRPYNKRVYCLSVTNDGMLENGRPSSSSSALDNIIFGNLVGGGEPQLFIVSGGNAHIDKPEGYPDMNFLSSIQDPGQAYNAITVGAYTELDRLSVDTYQAVAKYGGMSPFNTTSGAWETQWPNKPDVVFEGGNTIIDVFGGNSSHEELSPISLDSDFKNNLFLPFNGTSSAAALASKMAAELRTKYPNYWPETIRGLIIHSADWTEAMLEDRDIKKGSDRRAILRSVGYGVPDLDKAMNSANNSLTLIAEEYISPYKKVKSDVKYNEYHLYTLPWPKDILLHDIAEKDAKVTVTLSYYIEPNPGNKQYSRSFSYHSHELDFKLIKAGESLEEFKRRISAATEEVETNEKPDLKTEEWVIREGVRSRGSIKKDFLETSGALLSDRYYLAVYPKGGWYRTRKKLEKYNSRVRYSLIVSIETVATDIDIYTPVENIIQIQIPV